MKEDATQLILKKQSHQMNISTKNWRDLYSEILIIFGGKN